jgi:DsbC/DsbD-like thiol-disulfide interchange protein
MRKNMMFIPAILLIVAVASAPASNQKDWFEKSVKKIEAKFEPAEAKPGQTVTFSLTIELNPGYHTYPTMQPEKAAAGFVNIIKYPGPETVVFVGTTVEPKEFVKKAVPELNITEMHEYGGKVTYTRKAVVSPKAMPGAATVKLAEFTLQVCDEQTCFRPKKIPVEAALKVLEGSVPVDPALTDEVNKALNAK